MWNHVGPCWTKERNGCKGLLRRFQNRIKTLRKQRGNDAPRGPLWHTVCNRPCCLIKQTIDFIFTNLDQPICFNQNKQPQHPKKTCPFFPNFFPKVFSWLRVLSFSTALNALDHSIEGFDGVPDWAKTLGQIVLQMMPTSVYYGRSARLGSCKIPMWWPMRKMEHGILTYEFMVFIYAGP